MTATLTLTLILIRHPSSILPPPTSTLPPSVLTHHSHTHTHPSLPPTSYPTRWPHLLQRGSLYKVAQRSPSSISLTPTHTTTHLPVTQVYLPCHSNAPSLSVKHTTALTLSLKCTFPTLPTPSLHFPILPLSHALTTLPTLPLPHSTFLLSHSSTLTLTYPLPPSLPPPPIPTLTHITHLLGLYIALVDCVFWVCSVMRIK